MDISHGHTASTNALIKHSYQTSSVGATGSDNYHTKAAVTVNDYSGTKTTATTGEDASGKNIPPYKACYIWERLA